MLDVQSGEVVYCNAGRNRPYLLKQTGDVEVLSVSKDPMVGAIDGIEYHEERFTMEKGDALVMFTDGVTEAMNTSFEEFGEERLVETLEGVTLHSCKQIIEAVKTDVASFTKDAEQSDDLTLLVIKKL